MNKIMKRLISWMLAVVLVVSCFPVTAWAAAGENLDKSYVTEINDGYVSVSVSNQNGGFLIDTLLGNQLKDSDDGKNLLFASEGYDTSFTSIRVKRTDGSTEEYVFGRKYGFLGLASTDVTVEAAGSSIRATWGVKDLTVVQTLTLVDETNSQHGLVSIDYEVTTTSEDVENVQIRIMLDTALGDQDYGFYELYDGSGSFGLVRKECVVENAYDNMLRSVTGDGASAVNAYTVNAIVEGNEIKPYQVAFGHWGNLATTVFDFIPDGERPAFDVALDANYLTADSAYALYYDLGSIAKDETGLVSTYYGIYSNATVSSDASAIVNFVQVPSSMVVKDGSTLESASYYSQVAGGADGDVEVKMLIENIGNTDLEDLYVVVKTMNNVLTYTGNYPTERVTTDGTHTIHYTDVARGEELGVTLNFNVSPRDVGEYRYFEVELYSSSKMTEGELLGSNGFYLLCPSVLGEEVSFNTTNPQTIYVEGTRTLYVSGENFGLLRDTSAYTAYLKPVEGEAVRTRSATGSNLPISTVVPGKNIVVNDGTNTMNVVLNSKLAPGTYQLVLDWNEEGKEDTTSLMLIVHVSDDEKYMSPTFGVVTIEKTDTYTEDNRTYQLMAYESEEAYHKFWQEKEKANPDLDPDRYVLLEFYGNFSLKFDADYNLVEATATSIQNADGSVSGTINISNCLDVEAGYVTITVENPGQENQSIKTDIDGHVYISGERTTVWKGVCAITSITNGEENELMPYRNDGSEDRTLESTIRVANRINLLWPAVAGTFQEMMGVLFEMRYCEFGILAMEHTDKDISIFDDRYANMERTRVVSFSAYLDPGGLLPNDFDWAGRESTAADAVQLHLARSNYTAEQLRQASAAYKKDLKNWMTAGTGDLTIAIDNILYGDNRFIGFDAEASIALPAYMQGIGGIEGTLHLAIFLLDPAESIYFEMGVDGAIELEGMFLMEATLVIKSIHGIPIPDELYLYVGGFSPGLNLDGCGVLWLNGVGGGFSNLYESIMSKSKVPAFTVSMEGGFSLFQILFARLKLSLSARGVSFTVKGLGFNRDTSNSLAGSTTDKILTIIPEMGAAIYWYPKFKASANIQVNVLSIIEGGGYIVLEEHAETGDVFFEALATAKVKTPDIPLIGSITLGGVDVGIDLSRIYGVLHITKLDMGLTYYYGGDVDFTFGKYEVPGATLLNQKVGQLEDGTDVYLAFGTNVTQVASSASDNFSMAGITHLTDTSKPTITSALDRMNHRFTLGSYGDGDVALTVNFKAKSEAEARAIAMGSWLTEGISITNSQGEEYELTWLDTSVPLTEETANDANAILNYNKETGEASVMISFTECDDFANVWMLESSAPCELVMYNVTRLADMERVEYSVSGNQMTVNCYGSLLDTMDSFSISAVDSEGFLYHLDTVEEFSLNGDGSVSLNVDIPAYLSSGSYTIQVNAKAEKSNVSDSESAADVWNHVNPNQPAAPTVTNAGLGGDYTLRVDVASNGSVAYDGYVASVYVLDEATGQWVLTEYTDELFAAEQTSLRLGGSYTVTQFWDAEGNELTYQQYLENPEAVAKTTAKQMGLEAGKQYRVGISAYKLVNDNYLRSEEVFTGAITMAAPDPATVTVSGEGVRQIQVTDPMDVTRQITEEFYTNNNVVLNLVSDQNATITWELDNGIQKGEVALTAGKSHQLRLTGDLSNDYSGIGGLAEGGHTLKIHVVNENGDESNTIYTFTVDTVAPKIMLTGPNNGSFFGKSVTVSGMSEADAQVKIELDGVIYATANTDHSGAFSAEITMDTTLYEQTLTVYAVDQVGNISREYELVLTNELVGALDAELAIFFNGQDVTGGTIPADMDGYLELRYVVGDRFVTVPFNSSQGTALQWDVYAVQGSGSVKTDRGFFLETSADINGMLTATVDKLQVFAVLGGNVLASSKSYTVTLPADTAAYSVVTSDSTTVPFDGSFRFAVAIADGYSAANMVVSANGKELTADENGVYTIANIHSNKTVTITGVVDAEGPEITITVGNNVWREFLNTITFGIFFRETQKVTIEAESKGNALAGLYYYISTAVLTEEEVMALGDGVWRSYDEALYLEPNNAYVVYAKAVDNGSLITYASSNGLVLKNTAPVISGVENGGVYYGDVTVEVADAYLASVTLDGVAVTLDNGRFVIPADNGQHTIVAADMAGNSISTSVTVYKMYTITFMADNQVVATKQLGHGQSMGAEEFPAIPAKTGYDQVAPVWNPEELTNVTGDMTVVAVYTRNTYKVTLPQVQIGYTIQSDKETVQYGDSVQFTVEVAEGYSGENLVVRVNDVEISGVDGLYTYSAVREDLTVTVSGVADVTAPEAMITVGQSWWRKLLNTITFGLFFNDIQKVTVEASDIGSDMDQIYYHVSSTSLTEAQLEQLRWERYQDAFYLEEDGYYVIYVKAVDKAGNAVYISSDGIVIDRTAPALQGIENGGVYYGEVTVTVADEHIATIVVNEETVYDSSSNEAVISHRISLQPNNEEQTIVVTDKAGNVSSVRVTVYKIYTVTFVADGVVVDTMEVNHGQTLKAEDFPQIPAKTGYDQTPPTWDHADLKNVTEDITVTAQYIPNVYTVTVPQEQVGYTIVTEQKTVQYGESVRFTVEVAEGYDASEMKVLVNGTQITAQDGVYTYPNVDRDVVITVIGVADITAPDLVVTVGDNSWRSFLHTITFGLFFDRTQQATVAATDSGSGVAAVYYYISSTALTEEEVLALPDSAWSVYTGAVMLDPVNTYVVYAKAVDHAALVSYASSDGLVVKNTAPVISGVENGGVYYGNVTVTVKDEYLASVTLDGVEVALQNSRFVIPADNQQHTIVAVDRMGNSVSVTVTVYKMYTITFMADNRIIATMRVGHGQDLGAEYFPQIPHRDGYDQVSPYWNLKGLTDVTSDVTVVAKYIRNKYQVNLPREQIGYIIHTEQKTVAYGDRFTFTVEVLEGYSGVNMVVKVNDVVVNEVNGVYTYSGVAADLTVTVSGVVDGSAPEAQIQIGMSWWRKLLNTITFGLFFHDAQEVTIEGQDNGSDIAQIYYYISAAALTEAQLENVQWEIYRDTFYLENDGYYVIYVKAVDNAGNVVYISSDGIVIDRTAPALQGIEDGGVYYGDVTVTVTDDHIATIELDGKNVYDASSDEAVSSHRVLLQPADAKQTITVTDKAGNVTTMTVTVHEKAPEPTQPTQPTEPTEPPVDEPEPTELPVVMVIILVLVVIAAVGGVLLLIRRKKIG